MSSPNCERAIEESLQSGNALLKFLSRNDAGATQSHQSGILLPSPVWQMYTPHAPILGRNDKHPVRITWQDGRITQSVVTWYGAAKREYRLTRFGRDFPFLNEDAVGDLFVLIPKTLTEFSAFLLDYDEDIEDIEASLGVQAFEQWAIYQNNAPVFAPETEDECVERCIREICSGITAFPAGDVFSEHARTTLMKCVRKFSKMSMDDTLLSLVEAEYRIFQAAERIICQNAVAGCLFKDIDDFLHTAASIMNRRKARAGRSFENHVDHLLKQAGIAHVMRPSLGVAGAPDIIIPDVEAYKDETWPEDSLFVVGLKTTCKDRWRQVLNEAKRTKRKFIFTLQKGISRAQLDEMTESNVSLIVPSRLHKEYPADRRDRLWTVEGFVDHVRGRLATVSRLQIVSGPRCASVG